MHRRRQQNNCIWYISKTCATFLCIGIRNTWMDPETTPWDVRTMKQSNTTCNMVARLCVGQENETKEPYKKYFSQPMDLKQAAGMSHLSVCSHRICGEKRAKAKDIEHVSIHYSANSLPNSQKMLEKDGEILATIKRKRLPSVQVLVQLCREPDGWLKNAYDFGPPL